MLLSMLWNVVSVSIHAPVRGATFESDQLIIDHAMVSIHAPVRGATDPPYMQYAVTMFQFTLPCGERHPPDLLDRDVVQFQFTLPCGERLS